MGFPLVLDVLGYAFMHYVHKNKVIFGNFTKYIASTLTLQFSSFLPIDFKLFT